jgi:hypothetical protein
MDVLHGNHQVLAMIAGHWPAARIGHARDCDTIDVQLRRHRPLARPAGVLLGRRSTSGY